jgi:aspartate carbamoyltransferase catalytic subunit
MALEGWSDASALRNTNFVHKHPPFSRVRTSLTPQFGTMAHPNPIPAPPRHLTSINDLTDTEIETVLDLAGHLLSTLSDPHTPHKVSHNWPNPQDFILASLFYEPSTRTRLSFETAALRLGGRTITSSDPATSSAAKGESIADTVRVVSSYANVIVIRHPRDGAAKLAADYSPVPVINGGDGSHEHPTQTLCDLFTLQKGDRKINRMNVAIAGDLKGSRTVHSFVYALARLGANISMLPAEGMELPSHVWDRLKDEFKCHLVNKSQKLKVDNVERFMDVLYVTGEESSSAKRHRSNPVDFIYATRYQAERHSQVGRDYLKVDKQFLNNPRYKRANILHPLPRVHELGIELDQDERALYFHQAAYGVPVRMALISAILGFAPDSALKPRAETRDLYDQPRGVGLSCVNTNCIVHDDVDGRFTTNRFLVVKTHPSSRPKLRCAYCESDTSEFVIADRNNGWFYFDQDMLSDLADRNHALIAYPTPSDAVAAGFEFPAEQQEGAQGQGFPVAQ